MPNHIKIKDDDSKSAIDAEMTLYPLNAELSLP